MNQGKTLSYKLLMSGLLGAVMVLGAACNEKEACQKCVEGRATIQSARTTFLTKNPIEACGTSVLNDLKGLQKGIGKVRDHFDGDNAFAAKEYAKNLNALVNQVQSTCNLNDRIMMRKEIRGEAGKPGILELIDKVEKRGTQLAISKDACGDLNEADRCNVGWNPGCGGTPDSSVTAQGVPVPSTPPANTDLPEPPGKAASVGEATNKPVTCNTLEGFKAFKEVMPDDAQFSCSPDGSYVFSNGKSKPNRAPGACEIGTPGCEGEAPQSKTDGAKTEAPKKP